MDNKDYINHLIERDKVKQPVQSRNSFNRFGKPNAVCQCCGYILLLEIEQFCINCGQRFVEHKNDKFYKFHKVRDEDVI